MPRDRDSGRRFPGFQSPNYTMVPDELFDELMVELSGAELKVLLYIIRRTFGFKKDSDNISLSQLLNGIETREGLSLDRGTGLSKKTLLEALRSLEEQNIIATRRRQSPEKGNEPTAYRLNLLASPPGVKTSPPLGEKVRQGGLGEESRPPSGGKLPQGGGGQIPPRARGRNSPTQETVLQETEEQERERSKFRVAPVQEGKKDTKELAPTPDVPPDNSGEESARDNGGVGDTTPIYDDARQQLLLFVEDLARELNDTASLRSSTSRLANLYRRSGLAMGDFIAHLYAARATTQERTGAIRTPVADGGDTWKKHKMGYFFAVLEDRLGLRERTVGD
jgi:phage replication O-like protein O